MKNRICSIILVLCLAISTVTLPALATDEPQTGATAEQIIRGLGIMCGDENGNMNLSSYVTRAEFAKMLVAASEYKDTVEEGTGLSGFSDVKSTNWASKYIQVAVNHGWFVGYTDGTFRPNNTIKLEEAAATVLRLLGYSSSDLVGTYPTAQITKYKALELDQQISKEQGELLTRQDCMNLFCNLMTAETKSGDTYAVTMGYRLTSSGELDFSALVAANLKGPYTVASNGLILPFSTTNNVTIYKDDEAAQLSDVEPYDIYYYNTNLRTVYLYRDLVTGTYTTASPSAVSPTTVTVAGKSYTIGTASAAYKLSTMGEFAVDDVVTLLLGMDGTVADVVDAADLTSDDVDYTALAAENLEGPYTVDSNGLSLPFPATNDVKVYKNDEAAQLSDVEPYDIYYYNDNLKTVYLYRDLVTGAYTAASPNAVSPTTVTVAGKSYSVGTTSAAYKLSAMGEFSTGDIVTLLLGMDGTVADVVDATKLCSDEVDYAALVNDNLKGPYTVSSSGLNLPFSSWKNLMVYKNGEAAQLGDAEIYDIYYYNSGLNAVYLYSNRVTGTYTKASPNTVSPTAVTVAGNTYTLGTSSAVYKLSSLGQFNIGDTVTLLLAMDGTVADVIAGSEQSTIYYGVVTGNGTDNYTTETGVMSVDKTVAVACTDGVVRSFSCNYTPTVGSVVQVSYSNGNVVVKSASKSTISGTVNKNATMLGDITFASDVHIIDTDTNGNYLRIYPSRLAGYTFDADDVRFYILDSKGNISDIILNDATGDLASYGLLTSISELGGDISLSGTYNYIINGSSGTLSTSHILYNVSSGAARFIYESGSISNIKNLTAVTVSSLDTGKLTANNRTYQISESVQVYLYQDGQYTPISLTTVSDTNIYSLTAYYDNLGYTAGNVVRVIVACKK